MTGVDANMVCESLASKGSGVKNFAAELKCMWCHK